MSTTRTRDSDEALGIALGSEELPELTTADRLALRIGLALILWGHRHGLQQDRVEFARRSRAGELAAGSRDTTFEHRSQAGPTW
ncbi:MAG: hypothetical protein HIU86_08225 [Acidobacteria bacterium]|nr:hypothetical protein [Acidobacteriota bacterium]